jgi:hypothetical protein
MSIESITSTTPTTFTYNSPTYGQRKAIAAAAQARGMSEQEFVKSVHQGQKLTKVEHARGVSTDTGVAPVATTLTRLDATLTPHKATEIAEKMVAGTPDNVAQQGPPQDYTLDQSFGTAVNAVATALNLTGDQFHSQLASGTTLNDLAALSGVDSAALKSMITSALTHSNSPMSSERASGLADQIIAGPPSRQFDSTSQLAFTMAASVNAPTTTSTSTYSSTTATVSPQAVSALYGQTQPLVHKLSVYA